jgi:hypothetical protein
MVCSLNGGALKMCCASGKDYPSPKKRLARIASLLKQSGSLNFQFDSRDKISRGLYGIEHMAAMVAFIKVKNCGSRDSLTELYRQTASAEKTLYFDFFFK